MKSAPYALARAGCALALLSGVLRAQQEASLPAVTVYSPSIANQAPAGTFAMPVSSLRYDPQGKSYAQILMDLPVAVPRAWLAAGGPLAERA